MFTEQESNAIKTRASRNGWRWLPDSDENFQSFETPDGAMACFRPNDRATYLKDWKAPDSRGVRTTHAGVWEALS